jgi:hypothetical protein
MANKETTRIEGDLYVTSSSSPEIYGTGGIKVDGFIEALGIIAPHSVLTGLDQDDHLQYILGIGRSTGQTITGSTAASGNLTLVSTSNNTKGKVIFPETTSSVSSNSGSVLFSGGIGISNVTDAVSSTNGGTITTAGGLAVAKKAFVGGDLSVGGNLIGVDHSNLNNLTTGDPHTQYTLSDGRALGQTITGSTISSGNLTLRSTSNVTKGNVRIDETTLSVNSTSGALIVSGGIGISNVTDAVSSTNGGTITTAGGLAVAKKAFVGGDLSVGGNLIGVDHSNLNNLTTGDPHTQYPLSVGRTTGQTITGGTSSSGNLILRSTTNGTKGNVRIDETTNTTSSTTGALVVSGGIGITNSVDAVSSTNGGSFTVAGGAAINRSVYIGETLNIRDTAVPGNPVAGNTRFSSLSGTLISKNSSGTITTYQPTTTKGDILSHNGTTQVRVPVGINGAVLVADSSEVSGVKWGVSSSEIYVVSDVKSQGTNGGSASRNNFFMRDLNTLDKYPSNANRVSIQNNYMLIYPGTYYVSGSSPYIDVRSVTTRLFNYTASSVVIIGRSGYSNTNNIASYLDIQGIFVMTAPSFVGLEYRCQDDRSRYGLGEASGYQDEVYTKITLKKIA